MSTLQKELNAISKLGGAISPSMNKQSSFDMHAHSHTPVKSKKKKKKNDADGYSIHSSNMEELIGMSLK